MKNEEFELDEAVIAHMILRAKLCAEKGETKMNYHIKEEFAFTEKRVQSLLKLLWMRYGFDTQLRCFQGAQYWCYIGWGGKSSQASVSNIRNELSDIVEKNKSKNLYLAVQRVKYENNEKETMHYKLFKNKKEAIGFIIDSVIDDIGPESYEGDVPTSEELRETYNKKGVLTYGSDVGDLDDNGNWIENLFDVEYHVEELELLSQRPKHTFFGPNPWNENQQFKKNESDIPLEKTLEPEALDKNGREDKLNTYQLLVGNKIARTAEITTNTTTSGLRNDETTLSHIEDRKTYVVCGSCGHFDEVNKKLFAKVIGGAVAGFGFWAWVSFLFAGCGFALPLCIAIVTGGVAIAGFSEQIANYLCKKYPCPECGSKNWTVTTGRAMKAEAEKDVYQKEMNTVSKFEGSYDAIEIIPVMKEIYNDATQYIILSFPWYNKRIVEKDLSLMKDAIKRGVHIIFWYGIKPIKKSPDYESQLDRNRKTQWAIEYLKEELDPEFTHFQAADTHVKAIVCDKYVLAGSHNLMTYRVREGENARGENTSKFTGEAAIGEFLEKINSQPQIEDFSKYY